MTCLCGDVEPSSAESRVSAAQSDAHRRRENSMDEMPCTTGEPATNDDFSPSERRIAAAQILARAVRRLLIRATPAVEPGLPPEPEANEGAAK